MKLWLTIYRIATIVFIVVVIIAVISAFLPKIRQNQERQRKITALEEENRRKEDAIRALRKQQDQIAADPKYVEKLAREELGKAKAGETIYRFGKPLASPNSLADPSRLGQAARETRGKSRTNEHLPHRR